MLSSNSFFKLIHKSKWITLIFTALLTELASEIKVIPFNGEYFRFGLGSVIFFLIVLIQPPASFAKTGFFTGMLVFCFRILGDMIFDPIPILDSIKNHLPAFLFYFLYGIGLGFINIEKYKTFPLLLGLLAAGIEFLVNGIEHLMRYWFLIHENLGPREWALLSVVAIFRSYFVVGLYSTITVSEQKKRMQEMLEVGSELYSESLYLQKSMNHIEQITASSHDLYRKLKKSNLDELGMQALLIAQEIHEVKKDSQRILSGLSKITIQKSNEDLFLSDVLGFVVTANKKYSEMLKKKISFNLNMSIDFYTHQHIQLLALLNNLTANAVEAISEKGNIDIEIFEELEFIIFIINDTGIGIPEEDISIIFEPGYTTKYNDHGVAATGIGLSHVHEIVHTLHGQIEVESQTEGTTFRLKIPTDTIRKRGG
ncbi:sensor histidine kinase [Peribacillus alkalitolerans]|uniref:sensor histidine kinase n=1 Tax=Peribacillus alkalitolerans TaxID=1550385 RepID=UPI0013CFF32B|nr:sensor histidine kinase [Peribacillus alkalitolerans]